MFNTIFTIKDGDLVLNKEAILLELPFKTILKRDRGSTGDHQGRFKLVAYNEFKYIYYIADYNSYPNQHGFTEAKRDVYAVNHCELISSWKPDVVVDAAIKLYKSNQYSVPKETSLELIRSFRGIKDMIKKVRGNLDRLQDKDSLTKEDIADILYYYQQLLNLGKDVPKMTATLRDAMNEIERADKKQVYDMVRGTDEAVPSSMDPDREYDVQVD